MTNLKCYLSAPIDVNISIIRNILKDLDVDVVDFYSATRGISFYTTLVKQIRKIDFAIIVIKGFNGNIFYEMGICDGLSKPIFVLIAENESIPNFVQFHLHHRTNLDNVEILRLSLTKFVNDVKKKKRRPRRMIGSQEGKPIPMAILDSFLQRAKELRKSGSEGAVEDLVSQILKELQLQIVTDEKNIGNKAIDFVIWSDKLSLSMGNPILVEVKAGRLSEHKIFMAEVELKKYIHETEGKAGILLYLDIYGRRYHENYSLDPLIIRLDIEDLVNNLAQRTFEDAVLDIHDQIIHGASE